MITPDTSLTSSSETLPAVVVPLAALTTRDLARAGGKAVNLGELIQAGFPVPPGFTITTIAYDVIVVANDLAGAIAAARRSGNGAEVRAAFERAVIPAPLNDAIVTAYRDLGGGSVAVRSSATAEDLPGAAFAGQHDTFLGITDEVGLLSAVRRCWASLWSDRAIAYRQRRGFAETPVSLAIVVQRMVPAEAAGVLFTANPITGARDETVIDATTGLGEAIVSGMVTPDHDVLKRTRFGWKIVERRLGRREVEIRARAQGGTESLASNASSDPALPDSVLRRLARLGDAVQHHFGRPQDIEWAWADGQIALLQARPITALPTPQRRPGRFPFPSGGPTEYFQVRPYPLDMTSWLPAMGNALARMLSFGNAMPSFDSLWVEEEGVVREFTGFPRFEPSPSLLLIPLRMSPLAWRYNPALWRDDLLLAQALAQVRDLESRPLRDQAWSALLNMVREALVIPLDIMELRRRYFPRTLFALGGLRLALALLGESERFGTLLTGIDNKTFEVNRQLDALAASIRADPELSQAFASNNPAEMEHALASLPSGPAFLASIRQFLDDYGHRESASPLLVSQPTWKDSPDLIFGILKSLALTEAKPFEIDSAWKRARAEVLAHPVFEIPPLETAFIALIDEARRFPSLREDTHFLLTLPLPILRGVFLEMGRRLTEAGILASPDEVFHLRLDELARLADDWPPPAHQARYLQAIARARAERRDALADTPLMGLPPATSTAEATDALVTGTPGSPGVAEGPVRVVRDAAAFGTLQPGEVLVAPYTNPSWTPLFRHAAAVVVDAGSSMSHAAIVAREYGIPAVMGAGNATARLSDGERVIVDGTRGLVLPEPIHPYARGDNDVPA